MCPPILRAITIDHIRLRGHNIFLIFFRQLYRRLLISPRRIKILIMDIFRVGFWSRDLLRMIPAIIRPLTRKIRPVISNCLEVSVCILRIARIQIYIRMRLLMIRPTTTFDE
jgi:hypothetical protein